MGTNYYVAKNRCECCNRYDEEYHIGKDSYGWAFTFRAYRAERLVSWQAWKQFLKNQIIMNEYGEQVDYDWFVNHIETYKAPGYVREDGHKNLLHNVEARKDGWWLDRNTDWDDDEGYSFSSREFS